MKKLRSLGVQEALLGVGLFFIVLAFGLLWWDGIHQPYVDDEFSYSADVISANNAYDQGHGRFVGARYGASTVQLALDRTTKTPTIVSKVSNTDADGKVQATVEMREVDPATGRYKGGATEGSYVFGPRGASKTVPFSYQHVGYDTPALMKFASEDTIDGLKVYRYKADYSQAGRMQDTKTVVEGVTKDQGLELKPDLQIWIEPTSGWMVKFQEDTTLVVYDVATNAMVRPVRHFSNRMDDASVGQHVAYARNLQVRLAFVGQIAPGIMLVIVLATIFAVALANLRTSRAIPIEAALVVIALVPALVLVGWAFQIPVLTALFMGENGVNPLTALCFLVVGLGIVARQNGRQWLMAFFGGLLGILAGLQLLGSMEVLPFQMDLLLFKDAILSGAHASRMSPYEAFTFLVLSVVLVKAGLTNKRSPVHFARFAAGMVVMLGFFGVLVQFVHLEEAFTITFIQSLTVVASLLFVVCGFTLMQLFRHINAKPDDVKSVLRALVRPSLATVPIIIIGAFAQIQQDVVHRTLETNFRERFVTIENAVTSRMDVYSNTLIGAQALFASSAEVTEAEWHEYVATYMLPQQYPGIMNMGYAKLVPGGADQVRATANSAPVKIFPAPVSAAVRAPVVYTEPRTEGQQIGYDLLSDTVLREAMEQARDTGKSYLSSRLVAPSDGATQQPDLFLFAPVYRRGAATETMDERRAALDGYVFSAMNVRRFVDNAVSARAVDIDFEIYDGLDTNSENLMVQRRTATTEPPRLTKRSTMVVARQPWTVVYATQPGFRLSLQEELSPTVTLVGGSLVYVAVLALVYLLGNVERRKRPETTEIKEPRK